MDVTRRQFGQIASGAFFMSGLTISPVASAIEVGLRDRFADLYKAASQEGEVVFYSDGRQETAQRITVFWKQNFPKVALKITPMGSPALVAQIEAETAAGQHRVDVTHMSQLYVAAIWKRKGIYQPYKATTLNHFLPNYADSDGAFTSPELYVLPAAYNTKAFPDKTSLPKSLKDFLDPKWKGKIVLPDPLVSGNTLTFLTTMIAKNTIDWAFLEKLSQQDVLFVRGNPDAVRMLASGERVLTPSLTTFNIVPAQRKGQPIGSFVLTDGTLVVQSAMGIMAKAPHPNASKLLVEALLSPEGQAILTEGGAFWPADTAIPLGPGIPTIASFNPISPPPPSDSDQARVSEFLTHFKQVFHRH